MKQIPLKAHYVSGNLEGLAEFQSGDTIPIDHLGLRLDFWLENQVITNMTYDARENLEWVYYETGHYQQMHYDVLNDDVLSYVDYYDSTGTKINTLNITYNVIGNLINTAWVEY